MESLSAERDGADVIIGRGADHPGIPTAGGDRGQQLIRGLVGNADEQSAGRLGISQEPTDVVVDLAAHMRIDGRQVPSRAARVVPGIQQFPDTLEHRECLAVDLR